MSELVGRVGQGLEDIASLRDTLGNSLGDSIDGKGVV